MSYELIESERGRIMFQKGKPKFIEAASKSRKKEIQMKGNGKKLAVFVIVAAMAMFMVVAMASADPQDDHALKGQYAFSGPGQCVVSPTGFGANYIPNDPALVFASPQIWEGVYTFNRDGSGSLKASHRSFDIPGFALATSNISWDFEYNMTDKDRFQISTPPGSYDKVEWTAGPMCDQNGCATFYFEIVGPCDGVVARDGDTIIITCGQPTKLILCAPGGPPPPCYHTLFEAYCSFSHQGIRVRD